MTGYWMIFFWQIFRKVFHFSNELPNVKKFSIENLNNFILVDYHYTFGKEKNGVARPFMFWVDQI